jgi:hypothetical protein
LAVPFTRAPSNGASYTHFHPTPIFSSAFLILICIQRHPRANNKTQSVSVSLQSALTAPASQALVAHDRMEMLAALTSLSAAAASFLHTCQFSLPVGTFHVGTCAIWHRVTASPPSASSPCPATSKVEAASERAASWPCKANALLTSSGRCPVRASSAPSPVVPSTYLYWRQSRKSGRRSVIGRRKGRRYQCW